MVRSDGDHEESWLVTENSARIVSLFWGPGLYSRKAAEDGSPRREPGEKR
jgi:hypothetical protein